MESIFINIYQEITLAVGCCIGIMAVMLLRTYIPSMPHLKRLHTARGYLLASYIILSALNFVSAATGYQGIIDRTITLVVSSYQALLITATFIVFIRPNAISQRTIIIHFACITIYSFLLIASILWYPGLYSVAMWLAVTVYTFQLAFYTWWFEKAYKLSVKDVENFYDEDEEARLRWVKKGFYIMLGCGVTALIGLFFNGLYMLLFNILVVVCYTYLASAVQRYMYRMGFLMPVIAEEDKKRKELVDAKNGAEQLTFTIEKFVRDNGDKISEDDKKTLEEASKTATEEIAKAEDVEKVKEAVEKLSKASDPIFTKFYQENPQAAADAAKAAGFDPNAQSGGQDGFDGTVDDSNDGTVN